MSLHREPIGPVPEETVRVAQVVFRQGNRYIRLREALGTIFADEEFADLFSSTGRPGEAPWRLALVCILQFIEDLSDRQAAEAVRARIDWKYLLGLELTDPGFDFTLLTDFRARLLAGDAEQRIFEVVVQQPNPLPIGYAVGFLKNGLNATVAGSKNTEAIHQALSKRGLSPSVHLLDAGYVDAEIVLQSRDHHGIEVVGPVSQNNQWQSKAGEGYDLASFTIDWNQQQATCPQGKKSVKWTPRTDQHGHPKIAIRFGLHDCRDCPARSLCTRSATAPRILAVRTQAEFEVLHHARQLQQTEALFTSTMLNQCFSLSIVELNANLLSQRGCDEPSHSFFHSVPPAITSNSLGPALEIRRQTLSAYLPFVQLRSLLHNSAHVSHQILSSGTPSDLVTSSWCILLMHLCGY
ncbi:transposase [Ktedonobacteria bacterium brp13]|nr:transposase [Ktedonobacteria bacterium brp13]